MAFSPTKITPGAFAYGKLNFPFLKTSDLARIFDVKPQSITYHMKKWHRGDYVNYTATDDMAEDFIDYVAANYPPEQIPGPIKKYYLHGMKPTQNEVKYAAIDTMEEVMQQEPNIEQNMEEPLHTSEVKEDIKETEIPVQRKKSPQETNLKLSEVSHDALAAFVRLIVEKLDTEKLYDLEINVKEVPDPDWTF